ncbi:MAG: serine/threonine protein kinase, partial [Planctomycetaceae bacterium]|nr:serine/threonine protein kinase [Planctomycetaceae bacterium]
MDDDSFEIRERIDEVCDLFEAEWRGGSAPEFSVFLNQDPELVDHQSHLLEELLRLDISIREKRGQSLSRYDYLQILGGEWAHLIWAVSPTDADQETLILRPKISVAQFAADLEKCRLLSRNDFKQFSAALHEDSNSFEHLVNELIQAGKLTPYQASHIAVGDWDKLTMGQYLILDQIGAGGMGVVYSARHRRMQRDVAIKVLSKRALGRPSAVERFHREAQAAAKLLHPNIVTAFDADEYQGNHYLVMEFVRGNDLSKDGPLPARVAVDYVIQAARGLAFAHERGIIHRDIKPANLLLTEDRVVKILDMGLARIHSPEFQPSSDESLTQLTRSDQIMGTVDFMAPEQAADVRLADHRADIYSLGCTLYWLITGRKLYRGDTLVQRLLAHREQKIPSLREVVPDVNESLDAVFQKMVAKQPDERQKSMLQVIQELERCIATLSRSEFEDQEVVTVLSAPEQVQTTVISGKTQSGPRTTGRGPKRLWTFSGSELIGQFERALEEKKCPRIESFLKKAPPEDEAALVWGLLARELAHKSSLGEKIDLANYESRFPDHANLIQALGITDDQVAAWLEECGYTFRRRIAQGRTG